MFCNRMLKRAIPFVAALTIGLFVASFFVSVGPPGFRSGRSWQGHRQYHQRLESENHRLKTENSRMKRQLKELQQQQLPEEIFDLKEMNLDVPQPPIKSVDKQGKGLPK